MRQCEAQTLASTSNAAQPAFRNTSSAASDPLNRYQRCSRRLRGAGPPGSRNSTGLHSMFDQNATRSVFEFREMRLKRIHRFGPRHIGHECSHLVQSTRARRCPNLSLVEAPTPSRQRDVRTRRRTWLHLHRRRHRSHRPAPSKELATHRHGSMTCRRGLSYRGAKRDGLSQNRPPAPNRSKPDQAERQTPNPSPPTTSLLPTYPSSSDFFDSRPSASRRFHRDSPARRTSASQDWITLRRRDTHRHVDVHQIVDTPCGRLDPRRRHIDQRAAHGHRR